MPEIVPTALTANQHCNTMAALTLDIAFAASLMDARKGDTDAVEGAKQAIRSATEALKEHLVFFQQMTDPQPPVAP